MPSWVIPHMMHSHMHVLNTPFGLGEVFDDEMSEEDSEEDPSESE